MSEETTDVMQVLSFDEYVGQGPLKRRLAVHIEAALREGRMLDHVLLAGPPGCGKTTLARIIASQLGDPFASLTLPVKQEAICSFLRRWEGGVLLLDEIHRASAGQQEDLLNLLQDGYVQTPSGHRIQVPVLTVIGATTEPEKVIAPLHDRFPIKPTYVEYADADMATIVDGMGTKVGLELPGELAFALGQATGGIPRNARKLVFAVRDLFATNRRIPTAEEVLDLCNVEPDGLSADHIAYLRHLSDLGGQAGLQILASMMRLHPSILTDLERLLVQRGFMVYGTQGRELTQTGYKRTARHGMRPTGPSRLRVAAQA